MSFFVSLCSKVAEIEEAERDKMRAKCKKILSHGVNCFINRQLIYNFPEQVHHTTLLPSTFHQNIDLLSVLLAKLFPSLTPLPPLCVHWNL